MVPERDVTDSGVTEELTEIRRHLAELISIADTVARSGPSEAAAPGMARLYAEVEQLAAMVQESTPTPARREPQLTAPRQRRNLPPGPAPSATDYWVG